MNLTADYANLRDIVADVNIDAEESTDETDLQRSTVHFAFLLFISGHKIFCHSQPHISKQLWEEQSNCGQKMNVKRYRMTFGLQ